MAAKNAEIEFQKIMFFLEISPDTKLLASKKKETFDTKTIETEDSGLSFCSAATN